MSEPRAPRANEYNKIIDFLDNSLRASEPWSISTEYPLALDQKNINNIRIIEEDGKIVSHAVIKILLIKTPIAIFKVAAIGSVVTLPEYRNRGYSSKIIKSCIQLATEQEADIAILWTDIYDFYKKLGFELAGSESALIFHSPFDVEPQNLTFLQTNKVDPQSINKLFSKHSVGTMRNAFDIQTYLKIPKSKLYTAWDHNNQLQAYAVEGRGADLSDYIHEWGGGVSKILSLVSEIRKQKNKTLTLISPSYCTNLIEQATDHGALVNNGFLGMIKIINSRNLFFKIRRYARYLGQEDFILEHNGNEYILGHTGHIFRTTSEKDITQLIFGPQKASELHKFDVETTKILEQTLPIPMWIWGWDSV